MRIPWSAITKSWVCAVRAEHIANLRIKRAELEREKTDHVAKAPRGCRCPWCIPLEVFHDEFMAKIRAQNAGAGRPPF